MKRVVVIQPYVPAYRVALFEQLRTQLATRSIELVVAACEVTGDQALRRDQGHLHGVVPIRERRIGARGRSLLWRDVRSVLPDADLVVMEQARRNLEAYPLLLRKASVPVALWGHGRTKTRTTPAWEHQWLDGLTRRADWYFAYTEGGGRYMIGKGFPAERVTVVQNATDTTSLRLDRAAVTPAAQRTLRTELGLAHGRTALFLGALDTSKRIGFLLTAAETLAARLPGFTLVVAGDGPGRGAMEIAARDEPWLRYVGPVFGADKAALASVCDVMLNPGRVGLTVVDSFALGLPMVTTNWPGHAPEFGYLEDGSNGVVTRDNLAEFVEGVALLMKDTAALADLVRGCTESAQRYRIEATAERFARGICGALAAGPRRGRRTRGHPQTTSAA